MPFDGSGNFSRLYSWSSDRDNGIRILASRMDGEFDNFAAGMNQVFFRNGLVPMAGNLNMGQNYILGLGAGSVNSLSMRFADDPNSGLYLNGYNRPTMVSNGVNRLEANTTGVAVTGTMQVSGQVNTNLLQVSAAAGANAYTQYGTPTANYVTGISNGIDAYFIRENQFSENLMSFTRGANRSYKPFISDGAISRDTYLYMDIPVAGLADLSFDTGDVLRYTRNSNRYDFFVNSTSMANIDSTGMNVNGSLKRAGNTVWDAGNFTPSNYALLTGATFSGPVSRDANMYMDLISNTPTYSMDAGDLLQYDRTNNYFNFFVASGLAARITSSGTSVTGTFGASGAISGASVASSGAITQAGNQVWHAGNLNPANYAALNSAPTFTGQVSTPTLSTNNVIISGGASNAYVGYGTNNANYSTGIPSGIDSWRIRENQFGVDLLSINRGGMTVSVPTIVQGKLSRDTYLYMDVPVAGIADVSFDTGDVLRYTRGSDQYDFIVNSASRLSVNANGASVAGTLTTAGRITTGDSNHYLDIISGFTTHSYDSGDLLQYDRANNKFIFVIGSQRVATLDSAGNLVVKGNISSTNGAAVP